MKRVFNSIRSGLAVLPVVLLCVSCFKPDDTGFNLIPQDEWVEASYTDTFTVITKTMIVDSVRTGNPSLSLMGEYYDEQFGRIAAGTYTQFLTTGDNVVFSDTGLLQLDSVKLTLDLQGFYGKYDDPLPLEIFEITEEWPTGDTFYSNSHLAFDSTNDLGNGYKINFHNLSGFLDFISIDLDPSIGNKILLAPTDSLVNSSTFSKYFKGLFIRAKADQTYSREPGAIYYIDLLSSNSAITLYYKESGNAKTYSLRVKDDTQRFHHISRSDYATKLFGQYASDTSGTPMYNFLEAGNLVKMFVKIPYLSNIQPVGINRADLVLKVDPAFFGSDNRFNPSAKIFAFHADSTGTKEVGVSIHTTQGVTYDATSNEYLIGLDNNIMQIMNEGRDNNGFILVPELNGVTVNRAVIAGPGHPTLAPKLRVTYTDVPH